jgi:hypothetical protein
MTETWLRYWPLWAGTITTLGWLYVLLARFWPRLFHRETVRRAYRQQDGYRLGRSLYWQLSRCRAILIGSASLAVPLAAAWLSPDLAGVTLLFMTSALLALWLTHPPGQRLGIVERPQDNRVPIFVLLPDRRIHRALTVLILCGVIPAAFFGLVCQMVWGQLAG